MRTLYFHPVVSSSSIFFYLISVFLAYSQPSQIGCLPYFHTRCCLSANLGCRSETCYTRLAENTGRKNRQKFAICAPPYNFLATKVHIDNRKNMLSSNISFRCPHNMVNFGPLAAEIGPVYSLGHFS